MSVLNIVIIGGVSNGKVAKLLTPTSVEEVKSWAQPRSVALSIWAYDPLYDSKTGTEFTKSIVGVAFNNLPIQKFKHTFVEGDAKLDIRDTSHHVIYIDCTGSKSVFDTMDLVISNNTKNRLYIVFNPSNNSLDESNGVGKPSDGVNDLSLMGSIDRYANNERNYDLYSGAKVALTDRKFVKPRFISAVRILKEWLYARFHLPKEHHINPSAPYTMNMETAFIVGMIRYHSLFYTATPDRTPTSEFGTNPRYRQMLCDTLLKICANFAVNNGLITTNRVIEIGGFDGWKTVNAWIIVLNALLSWDLDSERS